MTAPTIYYFVHLTGRNKHNSGIQRVVRNLGAALQKLGGVTLAPVRWCPRQRAIVHAESCFREDLALFAGPSFEFDERQGTPIDRDGLTPEDWLLVPEAPHLGSHDGNYPSVHISFLIGYAHRFGLKTAFILHDIMPLSHLGRAESDDIEALKCSIYAAALADADLVLPVSQSSQRDLTTWFARTGVTVMPDYRLEAELLPEEMVRIPCRAYLNTPSAPDAIEFCLWGSSHPHKNQVAALEAFNIVLRRRPDLPLRLHLFGHVDAKVATQIGRAAAAARGAIRLHGFVDDDKMAQAIAQCRATVFVSLVEGFGLPVAESLWMGKPCLTSNIAPMSEVAEGGGCLLVDPTDRDAIADGIERLASSDALLRELKAEIGTRRMRTWTDYAAALVDRLREPAVTAERTTYVAEMVRRPMVSAGTIVIDAGQAWQTPAYKAVRPSLLQREELVYDRATLGHVADDVLCFGPYLKLPRSSFCRLTVDGALKGQIDIKVTARGSDDAIATKTITPDDMTLTFANYDDLDGVEFIATRREDTELFRLSYWIVERYF